MFADVPTKWIEAQYKQKQLTDIARGGHFANVRCSSLTTSGNSSPGRR
jgi:hypothetical protein